MIWEVETEIKIKIKIYLHIQINPPMQIISHIPKAPHEHGHKAQNLGPDAAQNDSAEGEARQCRTSTHEDQVRRCVWPKVSGAIVM